MSQPRERILLACLAAGLFLFGLPQLLRSTGRLKAGIESKQEVPPARLNRAAEQAEALDAALADAQGSLRGGLLRLRQALPTGGSADRPALEKAAEDLERGLARSPADGQAWAALSHADLALDRAAAAAKALSAGLFTAHADPYLNPSWCVLGVALWQYLDPAEQVRIADEIRWAWRDRRALILALARTDAPSATLLRNTLDVADRDEFDRRLQAPGDR